MKKIHHRTFEFWQADLPASLVVFLVALPLCLGVALASGAPLLSGLIAGVVGGVVVGLLSKSPLSVSGPAAGLTAIVFAAIQSLPSYQAFLLAVVIAGFLQIILGVVRAGVIANFIPNSVITGMLVAIGLILIMKQIPHAVGYQSDYFGDESFAQSDGHNTISMLLDLDAYLMPSACIISAISLLFLFWWDKRQPRMRGALRYIPGPLVVVIFGIGANALFNRFLPALTLADSQLVSVPVMESWSGFLAEFNQPDFSQLGNSAIWGVAVTLALVASIESLLSIEAIDKLDPLRRVTPTNRELMAQGAGNIVSGLIGGLPVTSVIVRSSANVSSGGRTKLSTIAHGVLLVVSLLAIPRVLNMIPLPALAAVLISVGYKLCKPKVFIAKFKKGWPRFIPFVVTVVSILITDLLIGILIGVFVGAAFVLLENFRSAILLVQDGENFLIRFRKDLFFVHKHELKRTLTRLPDYCRLLLDLTRINFIDNDNIDIINDFVVNASYRNIRVTFRHNEEIRTHLRITEQAHEAA